MVKKKSSLEGKRPPGNWSSPEEEQEKDLTETRQSFGSRFVSGADKILGGVISASKKLDKKIPSFEKKKTTSSKKKKKSGLRRSGFIMPNISQHQQLLREMFGGSERTWGTGTCLPKLHRTLTRGNGLIKSGDNARETASMFGFG